MRLAIACLAGLLSTAIPLAQAAPTPVGLGDFFRLKRAADPQIAPDGSRIAYVVYAPDVGTDNYGSAIRLVSVRDARDVPIASDAGMPRWSPDGRALAFVRFGAAGAELVIAEARDLGGVASTLRSVAQLPVAPRELAWSPDGTRLAFLGVASKPWRAPVAYSPPEGANWAPRPLVFENGGFQTLSDQLPAEASEVRMYVVDAARGAVQRVPAVDLGDSLPLAGSGLAWSRDGRRLLTSLARRPDAWQNVLQGALYSVDVDSGAVGTVAGEPGSLNTRVSVAANGAVAFTCRPASREPLLRFEACVGPSDQGPFRSLTADLDRLVLPTQIAHDGSGVYAAYPERGVARIAWFGLDGRREVLAETGGGDADAYTDGGAISVARDGTVAFLFSDARTPSEVAVVRRGTKPRVLTRLNADLLAARIVNPVEEIEFTPTDGAMTVHAYVVRPAGADPTRKVPAIVMLHGGQSSDYGPDFDLVSQTFAAHGYLVILPNYRGSGSYGRAFANVAGSPVGREHDVIGAAQAAVARLNADPERLYVMGGSGGALITGWTITRTKVFRAAVMWYAPVEWWTYAMESSTGPTTLVGGFESAPWERPAEYIVRSPYAYVGQVTTPTMLVVGDHDRITPVSGSIAFFRALQIRGVPSELVVYPGAGHGINARPSNAMGHIAETLGWLARYGGPKVVPEELPAAEPAR
jgi:dipeptidyl aminopeptidase/acylaminoacyl peptidase